MLLLLLVWHLDLAHLKHLLVFTLRRISAYSRCCKLCQKNNALWKKLCHSNGLEDIMIMKVDMFVGSVYTIACYQRLGHILWRLPQFYRHILIEKLIFSPLSTFILNVEQLLNLLNGQTFSNKNLIWIADLSAIRVIGFCLLFRSIIMQILSLFH